MAGSTSYKFANSSNSLNSSSVKRSEGGVEEEFWHLNIPKGSIVALIAK